MGFWIFMLFMNVFIPAIMIVFGYVFKKSAPKTINSVYGYRTSMSMKNQDTWQFAHSYFSRLWIRAGWIMLIVSAAGMCLVIGQDKEFIGALGVVLCMVQCAALIISIFPTEAALRKNFDKDGNRKK